MTAATAADAGDPFRAGFESSKPAQTHGAPKNRALPNPLQQLSASVTAGRLPSVNPGRLTAATESRAQNPYSGFGRFLCEPSQSGGIDDTKAGG